MIEEKKVTLRKQTPTPPNEWLYFSVFKQIEKEIVNSEGVLEIITEEVEERSFIPSTYLGKEESELPECTNAERLAWEEAHKPEEPQEVETVE